MKAVLMSGLGGIEFLHIAEHPDPVMKEDELLVRVRATALNRADLLQRRGKHPPPKGVPDILGLEMAGEVVDVGRRVRGMGAGGPGVRPAAGGRVRGARGHPGGTGDADPRRSLLRAGRGDPRGVSHGVPEPVQRGAPRSGETVLIHAGGSGVGTAAIQLVREAGGISLVTAGSTEKIARCVALGALAGWNYKDGPFAPWVAEQTGGRGVDIVLDFVGAPYFEQNLEALAVDGRMVVIGTLGGADVGKFSLRTLMSKRLQIAGAGLRSMDTARKIRLTGHFAEFALPRFADGRLVPIVDSVFDWRDVGDAHLRMESNANVGKIVLRVTG